MCQQGSRATSWAWRAGLYSCLAVPVCRAEVADPALNLVMLVPALARETSCRAVPVPCQNSVPRVGPSPMVARAAWPPIRLASNAAASPYQRILVAASRPPDPSSRALSCSPRRRAWHRRRPRRHITLLRSFILAAAGAASALRAAATDIFPAVRCPSCPFPRPGPPGTPMNSRPPRPPPAALPTPIDMDQRPGAVSARCLDSEGLAGADCCGGCPCLRDAGCCTLEANNFQKFLICSRFSINGNISSNVPVTIRCLSSIQSENARGCI